MTTTEPGFPTPPTASIQGGLATIWQRIWGSLLDGLILLVPGIVIGLMSSNFAWVVAAFALAIAYEVLLTTYLGGTLGKLALGLRVSSTPDRAVNIDPISAFKRYLVKGLVPVTALQIALYPVIGSGLDDVFDLITLVGTLIILFSIKQATQMQGYHDQFAKTFVIKR